MNPTHLAHTLANGLRVVVVPLPTTHRVVLSAHLNVGARFERDADNGISHFLEHMLYRGTPRHPSAHAQALAFERLGGTLVATTGVDSGTMAIAVPPESLAEVLELFAEVYRSPVFDGIQIEKGIVREEILEGLDDDGRQVDADVLLRRLCFQTHPLGLPITGTLEQLERFDRPGLERHHQTYYVAGNTVVAIAGPVDPERVLEQVERSFAGLPTGAPPSVTPPPSQQSPRFSFVRHAASSQTSIRLGFHAPGLHDALEPGVEMLLRVLDDGMSTRLYHRICDARGLCYEVSAGYEAYSDSGLVDVAADAAHDRALEVTDELLSVVRELRDHGPTDDELAKARTRHRWQLDSMLDDAGDIADFYGVAELTGTARTLRERRERMESVTREQVREAAERVFARSSLALVAVGMLSKKAQLALAERVERFD